MPKKTSTPEEREAAARLRPTFVARYANRPVAALEANLSSLKSQRDGTPPGLARDELAVECIYVWWRHKRLQGVARLEARIAATEPGPERDRLIALLAEINDGLANGLTLRGRR